MAKAATIIAISIIPGSFLLIVVVLVASVYLFGHPVSDAELKTIATTYTKAKCRTDEKDNKFCDSLYVEVGVKNEDIGRDFWIIDVRKKQDRDFYASFVINSKSSGLKVDESTYVLTYGK